MAIIIGHWQRPSGGQYVAWTDADTAKLSQPLTKRLCQGETMEILEYLPYVSGDALGDDLFGAFVTDKCRQWRQHLNGS